MYNKPIKEKKCIYCQNKYYPQQILQKVCSYKCAISFAKNANEKKRKQEFRKEKKVLTEKLKTLTDWHNDLQKEINSIVRTLDANHPCMSSQRNLGKNFDAGHLFSRGSNPHIRYHLFNIFAQSVHDNQWKSGNQLEFVNGIELTFGTEIKDYCLSLKGLPELKLSVEEIKEKIPLARGILKWLKLQDRKFSIEERISLRRKFNEEIGIYH